MVDKRSERERKFAKLDAELYSSEEREKRITETERIAKAGRRSLKTMASRTRRRKAEDFEIRQLILQKLRTESEPSQIASNQSNDCDCLTKESAAEICQNHDANSDSDKNSVKPSVKRSRALKDDKLGLMCNNCASDWRNRDKDCANASPFERWAAQDEKHQFLTEIKGLSKREILREARNYRRRLRDRD